MNGPDSERTGRSLYRVVRRRNEGVRRVHGYRTSRYGVVEVTEAHSYRAGNVIVNYARDRAFLFCRSYLFFIDAKFYCQEIFPSER